MGVERINLAFSTARAANRPAVIPYVTGGFPTLGAMTEILLEIDAAGADVIEVGFPFTDPIADGPVIAEAMTVALRGGTTPATLMAAVHGIRPKLKAAIVAMVTSSIVEKMEVDRFSAAAARAGFDGLIVPDIDLEVAEEWSQTAAKHNLAFTMLVAPTTTEARTSSLAGVSTGWVYVLARVGLTGERGDLPEVGGRLAHLRTMTSLPLAVGFGVSTPEHIRAIGQSADGVIVGSALVRRISESQQPARDSGAFVRELVVAAAAARTM